MNPGPPNDRLKQESLDQQHSEQNWTIHMFSPGLRGLQAQNCPSDLAVVAELAEACTATSCATSHAHPGEIPRFK